MPDSVVKKLSFLDRYLTVWIFLAIFYGVGSGYLLSRVQGRHRTPSRWGTTQHPIAIGLILMM
jgi:ACR3 family arsenite transporter